MTQKLEKLLSKQSIVKCSHCKKIQSLDEFLTHECNLSLRDVKTIPVIDFLDTSCRGKRIITATGIDGILYAFEVVPRKPIPITLPLTDEILQRKQTDEDFTESYTPLFKV